MLHPFVSCSEIRKKDKTEVAVVMMMVVAALAALVAVAPVGMAVAEPSAKSAAVRVGNGN